MSIMEEILELEGFKEPTPIQKAVMDRKDPSRDLLGISSTGSGKSHAFFMALFSQINPEEQKVQAVISVPTRELAYQLYKRIQPLADHFKVHAVLCVGGTEKKEYAKMPQIVIGTPGRLKDMFLDEKTLLLNTAKIFIVDEADMTLEFGFLEDVDAILSHMSDDVTVMVFSATISDELKPFLKSYLKNPEIIKISTDEDYQANIKHVVVPLKHKGYAEKIMEIIPTIQPYVCLIFTNSNKEAASLSKQLREEGVDLIELHGDLQPRTRNQAIRQIQEQKKTYIVASDIASRGIDLDGVSHVISCGLPKDLTFYMHRAGRTGRAGRDGMAIVLAKDSDQNAINSLEGKGIKFTKMDVKNGQLTEVNDRAARIKKPDKLALEIAARTPIKSKKVKPNYKKKRKEQIERARHRAKRQLIQDEIRKQKRERAKAKQRNRSANS